MTGKQWWASELPTLRLNAGAMVRQPEMLAPRPYGLLASRALVQLNPQGSLKTIYAFQAAFFAAA